MSSLYTLYKLQSVRHCKHAHIYTLLLVGCNTWKHDIRFKTLNATLVWEDQNVAGFKGDKVSKGDTGDKEHIRSPSRIGPGTWQNRFDWQCRRHQKEPNDSVIS